MRRASSWRSCRQWIASFHSLCTCTSCREIHDMNRWPLPYSCPCNWLHSAPSFLDIHKSQPKPHLLRRIPTSRSVSMQSSHTQRSSKKQDYDYEKNENASHTSFTFWSRQEEWFVCGTALQMRLLYTRRRRKWFAREKGSEALFVSRVQSCANIFKYEYHSANTVLK